MPLKCQLTGNNQKETMALGYLEVEKQGFRGVQNFSSIMILSYFRNNILNWNFLFISIFILVYYFRKVFFIAIDHQMNSVTKFTGLIFYAFCFVVLFPCIFSYIITYDLSHLFVESKSIKYEPGKFGYAVHLMVDGDEENFTKVIYQDENGNKEEIPIQDIVPEIAQNHNATEVLHPSEPLFLYFQVA